MKIILGLAMAIVLAGLSFPSDSEAFDTLRAANGRLLLWNGGQEIILRIETNRYFRAYATWDKGFFKTTQYPGAELWVYYSDSACAGAPMDTSYVHSPNWGGFMEYARFVDEDFFYVPSQKAIPTAANAILSSNSLQNPTQCYSTAGWWDETVEFVFVPLIKKPIAHFGNLPLPWVPVVPQP